MDKNHPNKNFTKLEIRYNLIVGTKNVKTFCLRKVEILLIIFFNFTCFPKK